MEIKNPADEYEVDPSLVNFYISAEDIKHIKNYAPDTPVFGQARATAAIKTGLGIRAKGYNIFIMGASGVGRRTALASLIQPYAARTESLKDALYVYNFDVPASPRALLLPAGQGARFSRELKQAVAAVRRQIAALDSAKTLSSERSAILCRGETKRDKLIAEFEAKMERGGFKPVQTSDEALDLYPIVDGEAVSFKELQEKVDAGKFDEKKAAAIRKRYYEALRQMSEFSAAVNEQQKKINEEILSLRRNLAAPIVKGIFDKLAQEFPFDCVGEYLQRIQDDMLYHLSLFSDKSQRAKLRRILARYRVNLLCDSGAKESRPLIHEELPTFSNLFGSIEPSPSGREYPDDGHLRLRPGAIHRAYGGYLVLRLQDILQEEASWAYLKRILQTGSAEFQPLPGGTQNPSILKPQPLPCDLKVVMLGGEKSYDILYNEDPDFRKLFKICAEFDSVMTRSDEAMAQYIAFCKLFCKENDLLPPNDEALAAVIAIGCKLAENRDKLSTRFSEIADLLTEADYYARSRDRGYMSADDVNGAADQARYLHSLSEENFLQSVDSGEIIISITGSEVGKVNGLAVIDRGYYSFGIPVSITARAAPGSARGSSGILNAESESGLAEEIYDKAAFIIRGFLSGRYARNFSLHLSATVCMEQSYSLIDGDSASCAELFALLSAIAGVPMRQNIAVTGSINQMGFVQPVGGVTEKTEAFFNVCKTRGLTGDQGVIIPKQNLKNLTPSLALRKAVMDGQFHIWTISHIDEGIQILSGLPAGKEDDEGLFPVGSFNDKVQVRLNEFVDNVRYPQKIPRIRPRSL